MFDINQIMSTSVNVAGDVNYAPIPQGVYTALIKEVKLEERQHEKINDGTPFVEFNVTYLIDDDDVRAELEKDEVIISDNYILDVTTDENGRDSLDFGKGKNIKLNRLRETLGQNEPGVDWQMEHLKGKMLKIQVTHTPRKSGDGVYANVSQVAAI